jgi:hypothetical protein
LTPPVICPAIDMNAGTAPPRRALFKAVLRGRG